MVKQRIVTLTAATETDTALPLSYEKRVTLGVATDVVKQVRAAELTVDRARDLSQQLESGVDADAFAAANPDVAPIFVDLVKRYGPAGAQLLLLVLTILSFYLDVRGDHLGAEQVELGREQVRLGERQVQLAEEAAQREAAQDKTTGGLTDRDVDRIAKAVEGRIAADEPKPKPKRTPRR